MSQFDWAMAALAALGSVVAVVQLRLWLRNWGDGRIDTFESVERNSLKLLAQIEAQGFRPDFVLGIGRSGAFLAGWLAGNLGTVSIEVVDRKHGTVPTQIVEYPHIEERLALLEQLYGKKARVLVVEGAATRGNSFIEFENLRRRHANEWDCRYAVLYEVDTNVATIHFVAKRLGRAPKRYPWHKTPRYRNFIRK